jgi:hypothetical protein
LSNLFFYGVGNEFAINEFHIENVVLLFNIIYDACCASFWRDSL